MNSKQSYYSWGTYRGGLNFSGLNISNIKFYTDGLNLLWNKSFAMREESWTEWEQCYGKFSNGADELITKGYRHYTITFDNNIEIDFYIFHMDADTDTQSNEARASQWQQLCNVILASKNGRPKIVMGDTNSRYTRDDILGLFINPITTAGNYTVNDVWVDQCKNGIYPTLGSSALMVHDLGYIQGEIVDKVLYLNPTHGGISLTPQYINFDESYNLGDHLPVIVEFIASGTLFKPTSHRNWWVGENILGYDHEVFLYNVGSGFFITNNSKPSINEIDQAPSWYIRNNPSSGFTVDNSQGYRLKMAEIVHGSGATTFKYETGNTSATYKFTTKSWNKTKFFNVDVLTDSGDIAYTAANTKSIYNDWLLISPAQKNAYDTYVNTYNTANSLYNNNLSSELRAELISILSKTSNYSTFNEDINELNNIISRINAVNPQNQSLSIEHEYTNSNEDNAEIETIYNINGLEIKELTKGVNILKMKDGTIKKLFVK